MNHPFIVQIDHVGIVTSQPQALFRFFSEELLLPVPFPFMTNSFYTGGCVSLGNCFLEIMKLNPRPVPSSPPFAADYYILGFLLERGMLQHTLHELAQRHLSHSGIMPFFAPEATDSNPLTLWDNIYLGNLLGVNVWQRLFLAMTHRLKAKPSTQQSTFMQPLGVALLRRAFRHGMPVLTSYYQGIDEHAQAINPETLRACDGGALGIEIVDRIVVNAPDANDWVKLLGPPTVDKRFVWQIGDGPALHLNVDQQPEIASLTLKVTSLARARQWLTKLGVQMRVADNELTFTVPQTHGLNIHLSEALEP